jgi:membrane fusion protein (multidrug efflux system)
MKRITILSGLIALISLTSCNSKQEKEVAETYSVTNPSQLTLHSQRICSQIRSIKNIEIRALEKGSCKKFDEGQYVKEGQLLFKIPTFMRLNIAIAEVKAAEIEVQNTKVLSDKM